MDISKYKGIYLQETKEHLSGIEQGLLALEASPQAKEPIENLFRHYHSIKGMSASMGFEPITKLAHAQEDLLDKIRSKKLNASQNLVTCLFLCLDAMNALVKKVEEDSPLAGFDISAYTGRIKAMMEAPAQQPVELPQATQVQQQAPKPPTQAQSSELKLSQVMKVDGKVFDELLATVGDLFMILSAFKSLPNASRSIELKDGIYLLGKSINSMHSSILSARMLPMEDLTASLPRVIRDMSVASGKEVRLQITGGDISLDRAILENLASPLVHIIRNAVDHGIEPPEERTKTGKPAAGTIRISAHIKNGRVLLEITDDGKGFDLARIKEKARQMGVPAERIASMSDKEAFMLVCLPGLSSASSITETSGRGVGMDVVKQAIEGLGGAISIDSQKGVGTRFTLELPRTTSITKALTVYAAGETFLIPVAKILKVMQTTRKEIRDQGGTIEFEGRPARVIPITDLLGINNANTDDALTIILVENGAARGGAETIGIAADDFGDEIDAYVKPLLPPISKLWGASGLTIIDGRPVFLLDIPQLLSGKIAAGA